MSNPHRCQCKTCGRFLDGKGMPWDEQTECRHDLDRAFSTMRAINKDLKRFRCYVCKTHEASLDVESIVPNGDTSK